MRIAGIERRARFHHCTVRNRDRTAVGRAASGTPVAFRNGISTREVSLHCTGCQSLLRQRRIGVHSDSKFGRRENIRRASLRASTEYRAFFIDHAIVSRAVLGYYQMRTGRERAGLFRPRQRAVSPQDAPHRRFLVHHLCRDPGGEASLSHTSSQALRISAEPLIICEFEENEDAAVS